MATNLEQWTAQAYAQLFDEDYSLPSWILSADKSSVRESQNCQPSLFYSDFPGHE